MHSRELPILNRLEKLDEAVAAINNHNRNQCLGCIVKDFDPDLLNAFFSGEVERASELASSQRSVALNVREVIGNHGRSLREVGFDLEIKEENQIGIVLIDADKAINFVSKIPLGWSSAKIIAELARTIEPFLESLDFIDDQNLFKERAQDARLLVNLLSHRGMASELEGACSLLNAATGGYFKEQLRANRSQLLNDELIGPSRWHHKMIPKNLYAQWQEALNTFREVRRNSNAFQLANDLEKVLREGIEKFESSVAVKNNTNTSNGGEQGKLKAIAHMIRIDFEELLQS